MNLCKQFDSLSFAFQALIVVGIYFIAFRLLIGPNYEAPAAAATALWMTWAMARKGVKSLRARGRTPVPA